MNKAKIDLNAPAFGEGAQKPEDLEPKEPEAAPEVAPAPESQPKEEIEVKEEEKPEASVEEQKVPYSRFKNVHQRALDAEKEAAEWRAKAESIKPVTEPVNSDIPNYWIELYGDSEASKRAWNLQQERDEAIKQEAREEALRAVRNERDQEQQRDKENLDSIEENFNALSVLVGRDLTEKEQSSVLDIVDEYTPKDKDGNYLGAPIPFDKAWEVHELKNKALKASTIKSRDAVASLIDAQSQGEPDATAEKNKNFNPLNWNAWKERLN